MRKYLVITGGVLSGLGKGVALASIGHLLSSDYKVVPIKAKTKVGLIVITSSGKYCSAFKSRVIT